MAHSGRRAEVFKPVARHEVDDANAGVDRPRRCFDQRLEAAVGARDATGDQAGAAAAELGVPDPSPTRPDPMASPG